MNPIPPSLELLTPDQMARIDRHAADTVPGGVQALMQHAGRAVARAAMRHTKPSPTLVLCGPGNNGGDGYVAARLLAQQGWPVSVAAFAPPRAGSDAAGAAADWRGPLVEFGPGQAARAGLVIDAVFGAGLARPVEGVIAETLAAAGRLLAVDTPSGVDGATGAVRGYAPQAWMTVTFHRRKPGHLLLPGRALLGRLELADIGIRGHPDDVAIAAWHNQPGLWRLPEVGAESHKYSRGVVSVCGGAHMTGAARLSAAGARGAGAGLVRIAAEHGADIYRMGAAGLIVDEQPLAELLEDERRHVWVCGPGLGADEVRATLPALLAAGRQVVADAGALTEAAGSPERLRGVSVATPHAGEFRKVFGDPGDDRAGAARRAAASFGGVLLLKGSDTIVAAPDGRISINDNATAWLGTAGSGDVLSGIVAACLAGGMEPFEAASAAVWLHGEAGRLAGDGLIAEDLPLHLPDACKRAREMCAGLPLPLAGLISGGA
ncbi:NAD(P)H-hydrate dehydratase [Lichenicola sp.]|uniref:NAD(P)H-hydrate dehydratase n=1 Tax=Lichenicola sp. TaxID=2804529 RepID=UPI003B00F053